MTARLLGMLAVMGAASASIAAQTTAAPATQAPQGRLSFSATLESIRVNVRPDEVVTRQFRLTLDPGQPRTRFRARVEDWWRSEDGSQSHYAPAGTLRRSCARWVSINPVDSIVGSEETLVVRMTVNVPHEVPNGGFWCVLTVDEVADPEEMSAGVGVKFLASVSTGIFLYAGDVRRLASIVDLKVASDTAVVTVQNDGNAPIGVEGRLEFLAEGASGNPATLSLPRTTVLTEPVTRGVIQAALPPASVLPSGRYRVRAILDFGADHLVGAEREIEILRGSRANGPGR